MKNNVVEWGRREEEVAIQEKRKIVLIKAWKQVVNVHQYCKWCGSSNAMKNS